ncbi:hypothetical protein SVIOM342S_04010 [Streptomyces violaceorubidus]
MGLGLGEALTALRGGMQRVSEEKRLLGGEEAVGSAAVSRTVAVTFGSGSFRTVPEGSGGAADGVGDARDEVGTVGPRGTGRLARRAADAARVHGRRRVGGAGQPRGAEAVPAGRGPVVHGNDEGRTGGRERHAEDAVVGGRPSASRAQQRIRFSVPAACATAYGSRWAEGSAVPWRQEAVRNAGPGKAPCAARADPGAAGAPMSRRPPEPVRGRSRCATRVLLAGRVLGVGLISGCAPA